MKWGGGEGKWKGISGWGGFRGRAAAVARSDLTGRFDWARSDLTGVFDWAWAWGEGRGAEVAREVTLSRP